MDKDKQFSWIFDLCRMGQSAVAKAEQSHVWQQILEHLAAGLGADGGMLAWCKTRGSDELIVTAALGPVGYQVGDTVFKGEDVPGWVLVRDEAVLVEGNAAIDGRFQHVRHFPQITPLSTVSWPLKTDQERMGTLTLYRFSGSAFTADELKQGALLADLVLVIIQDIRLNLARQQQISKLEENNKSCQEASRNIEEKHAQLLANDERLNSILASLDDVVWSVLPETFETIYINQAAQKVYGRPAEDFYRQPNLWMQMIHPTDRDRVLKGLGALYEKGVSDFDYRIQLDDGEMRWLHDHVCVIYGEAGQPVRLDGITVDITKHKLAEESLHTSHKELKEAYRQLQEVQGQLLQSEKMASIGQLAAGVAHEINNPIGYVYSNLGSLQKYVEDIFKVVDAYEKIEPLIPPGSPELAALRVIKQKADLEFLKEDVKDLMNESYEGITRVKKIVQDLKDFSHAGTEDEWQWSNLHHGLDSTLNIVWNELKYKAEIKKEYGDVPDVECLPSQLNQVFMNLLVNAAHAIEERGAISIRTGRSNGDKVWIEVSDTGKGISPENLSRIFDPFFTTKPVGKGTGLGLSVSYSIIQKHHGSINVASETGIGTTFHISLPIKQPAHDQHEQ
jgi:PAS domain S-box-containing protein